MTESNNRFTLTRFRWLRTAWAVSHRRHLGQTVTGVIGLAIIGIGLMVYMSNLPTVSNASVALSVLSLLSLVAAISLFVWGMYHYVAVYRFDMEALTYGLNVGWSSNWFAVSPLISKVELDKLGGDDGGKLHVHYARKNNGNSSPELVATLNWLNDHYAYTMVYDDWFVLVLPQRLNDPTQNWLRPIITNSGAMYRHANKGAKLQSASFVTFPLNNEYYRNLAKTLQNKLQRV